jgi:membrane associated rhomboid family serine protease
MAFFQDPSREPFLRAPSSVIGLIALLIGLHAARILLFPGSESDGIFETYGLVPARYAGYNPGTVLERILPPVTYLFLHGSWSHVLINSVWLLAFGPVVARRFGPILFLLFFVLCGIAGAVTHLIAYWGSTAPVIGASAAISGLMAASFRMLPAAPDKDTKDTSALAPILSARILGWTALWVALNVFAGVSGFGSGGAGPNMIAWGAHLGGYAAGLLLAGPFNHAAQA